MHPRHRNIPKAPTNRSIFKMGLIIAIRIIRTWVDLRHIFSSDARSHQMDSTVYIYTWSAALVWPHLRVLGHIKGIDLMALCPCFSVVLTDERGRTRKDEVQRRSRRLMVPVSVLCVGAMRAPAKMFPFFIFYPGSGFFLLLLLLRF